MAGPSIGRAADNSVFGIDTGLWRTDTAEGYAGWKTDLGETKPMGIPSHLGQSKKVVCVGGGLGVDYDGSNSTVTASVNYTVQEYANDVVYTFAEACRELDLPMPHLISESGRALTAHHALLLVNVIDVESQIEPVPPPSRIARV